MKNGGETQGKDKTNNWGLFFYFTCIDCYGSVYRLTRLNYANWILQGHTEAEGDSKIKSRKCVRRWIKDGVDVCRKLVGGICIT